MKKLPYKNKSQVKTRPDFYFLDEGNREAAYNSPCPGTQGRRYPFPLYAIGEFRWGEIAGLRIIFLVVVHGDGDAPSFIRNRRIPMGKIARLRIIFPVEVHRDGDTPSLYTQNENSERGNLKAAYKFPHRNGSPFPLYAKCRLAYK